MPKSIFNEAGIALASVFLIIAGIALTRINGMLNWGGFCISLGFSLLFFILGSKSKDDTIKNIATVIGVVSLVAAIIFFATAI